jgi:uncharacterized damage-inducible protein DinB
MLLPSQIATQFREVLLDGKWIANTNIREQLSDLTWQEATTKIGSLNTIAILTFHINYYVAGILQVLEGGSLDIRDKYSFDMPPIRSQEDWDRLRNKFYSDAERFATLVEQMQEEKLAQGFVDEKYGNYYRNLTGMVEHSYYHFGQIVLIKKMVRERVG